MAQYFYANKRQHISIKFLDNFSRIRLLRRFGDIKYSVMMTNYRLTCLPVHVFQRSPPTFTRLSLVPVSRKSVHNKSRWEECHKQVTSFSFVITNLLDARMCCSCLSLCFCSCKNIEFKKKTTTISRTLYRGSIYFIFYILYTLYFFIFFFESFFYWGGGCAPSPDPSSAPHHLTRTPPPHCYN